MAKQGTFYGTTDTTVKCRIEWSAVQSVTGNYSDVTATLSYLKLNSNKTYGTWKGSITIAGQQVTGSRYLSITNEGYVEAVTATVRVQHDSYGKAGVTISGAGGISGTSLSKTTISATVTLDTIARASTISATDANIESASTVVISRKNDTYTHSIAYQFGNLQGYVNNNGDLISNEVMFTETTLNITLPESFYDQIPNAPTGVGILTCRTYSAGDLVGEPTTCKFTATAAADRCAPLLEAWVEDVEPKSLALTEDAGTLIRFVSTARCYVTATARNGSTIQKRQVQGETVTQQWLDFPETQWAEYRICATDSRGYTTYQDIPCNWIPYVELTANLTVTRLDPTSGRAKLILEGNCYRGSFGAAENTLEILCKTGGQELHLEPQWIQEHSYRVETELQELDYDKSHTLEVTVTDKVRSVRKTVTVKPGIPVFDWGEADFAFHVPVTAPLLNGLDTGVLFQYRGVCENADAATLTGMYQLTEASENAPNQNGVLLVFTAGDRVLQLAVDFGAEVRSVRTIWYGTPWPWKTW